jgi:thiosulfate/3-mercaptopyruvate sulfurtransferase
VAAGEDEVIMHQMHGSKLACQVCHSVAYTNCAGCHIETDPASGSPAYQLDHQESLFLIGRNPLQSYERPYEYVPVRHAPVSPDSFGPGQLLNFNRVETWKYATPHNIQLKTPQTASCNTCHGNESWFLTADKVDPIELEANKQVIIDQIPVPITSAEQLPAP